MLRGHGVGGAPYAGASRIRAVRVAKHRDGAIGLAVTDECRFTTENGHGRIDADGSIPFGDLLPSRRVIVLPATVEFHVATHETDITDARKQNAVAAVRYSPCRGTLG